MDLSALQRRLAEEFLSRALKAEGDERRELLMRVFRLLYPLYAESKGPRLLELYTLLKEGKAVDEALSFAQELLRER
ncbi:MAG: hypothetical protein GXO03_02440 [Aquificae bacterium]|nr:hypothetical protein [Aquificota bacterium]